ncbi:hypothetical protein SDRG_07108 [Saprolegnia diclina VS20]|uniref:Transmembrane protein 14C n=1 Tax=Saprolegnia diclina (strain VS20) TaxID=1156394 RepID=T0RS62_SAPDV|nr:hypothetical protein SDRG_07108 [Saprolegnia diclina VS20]EQC35398.1 hypothetical protein SDRG_07108 [Saprolegnia diclina VS20]|eukprot:XP_008611148.1 hypothetical protein SDRG_07108 [Saprolegnia diclina VS20]
MYDFCLTLPYGGAIALGGLVGYVNSGSVISLTAGLGAGSLLLLFGTASYQEYQQSPKISKLWSGLSLGVSSVLTVVMGLRYKETNSLFPAGVVAGTSAAMSAFYLYKLASNDKASYNKKK